MVDEHIRADREAELARLPEKEELSPPSADTALMACLCADERQKTCCSKAS